MGGRGARPKAAAVAKTGGGLKAVLGLMAAGGVTAAAVQSGQAPDATDGSVAPAPSPAAPRIPKFAQDRPPK